MRVQTTATTTVRVETSTLGVKTIVLALRGVETTALGVEATVAVPVPSTLNVRVMVTHRHSSSPIL